MRLFQLSMRRKKANIIPVDEISLAGIKNAEFSQSNKVLAGMFE
jgi:hypothetical protein